MSDQQQIPLSNVPEFSVSELAFSLKRTIEDNFSRVRVRGELSRVSIPKSGHMYTSLKDDKSVIDAVCWKGVLSKLSIKPEEGLEVICIGRITTYPARSNYQLIIESMELAGEGALLKMLEDRKKRLAAEGLFEADRKKAIPFIPHKIGVVTSPTGAVIRDILHRLADRFPRDVMVWPVKVQGEGASQEVTNAVNGFNSMPPNTRPDLIIVARGGGSLEDLMPFNEENVVRAVAASDIPVISAVGHETDTTLVDYASDLRAPTPTGAAEMAVPMRMNLLAQVVDNEKRLISGVGRLLSENRHKLEAASARLGNPDQLFELKTQHIDRANDRLEHSFKSYIARKTNEFTHHSARLLHPVSQIKIAANALNRWSEQLDNCKMRGLDNKRRTLTQLHEKLELLSFENVLKRGYVVVRDENNRPVTSAGLLSQGQAVDLQFMADKRVGAVINNSEVVKSKTPKNIAGKTDKKTDQGSLF